MCREWCCGEEGDHVENRGGWTTKGVIAKRCEEIEAVATRYRGRLGGKLGEWYGDGYGCISEDDGEREVEKERVMRA